MAIGKIILTLMLEDPWGEKTGKPNPASAAFRRYRDEMESMYKF